MLKRTASAVERIVMALFGHPSPSLNPSLNPSWLRRSPSLNPSPSPSPSPSLNPSLSPNSNRLPRSLSPNRLWLRRS